MQLLDIIRYKCPKCKKNNIFNSNGNLFRLQIPKMNERCKNCNYKYEIETGFFFGAMYVSYGLTVAQIAIFSILSFFFFEASLLTTFLGVIVVSVLLSILNYKLARTIWIYLFYKST